MTAENKRGKKGKTQRWRALYEFVKRIPKGRVVTYGQLARAVRLPGGARTAGWAMGACPKGQGIPWHRVVGAGGRILLSEPHAGLQTRLLQSEGVEMPGGRVTIATHQWSKVPAAPERKAAAAKGTQPRAARAKARPRPGRR